MELLIDIIINLLSDMLSFLLGGVLLFLFSQFKKKSNFTISAILVEE